MVLARKTSSPIPSLLWRAPNVIDPTWYQPNLRGQRDGHKSHEQPPYLLIFQHLVQDYNKRKPHRSPLVAFHRSSVNFPHKGPVIRISAIGPSQMANNAERGSMPWRHHHISPYPYRAMGLLSDTQNRGLRMRRECRERFPHHRFQRGNC